MNTTIPDLWPKDLQPSTVEPAPVKILRQQAYALGQRTRNFVVGKVQTTVGEADIVHQFWVLAPFLNFEERVLFVRHGKTNPYPATITTTDRAGLHLNSDSAGDSQAFMAILQSMFAQRRFTDLLGTLLTQSDESDEE